MRRLIPFLFVLLACNRPHPLKEIVLEYDSHCPLHVEQEKDYYKVLPMSEQCGEIIIYDDSLRFKSDNDSLSFVLYVLNFNGDPMTSRIVCRSQDGEDMLFMLGKQKFSKRYDACILTRNGGHYFDIRKVR